MTQASLFRDEQTAEARVTSVDPLPFNRVRDRSLDFRDIRASSGVHGIHPYPAMLHFLVVRKLIEDYSHEGATVMDPFMGSGVTAVECLGRGRNYAGFDINPLAVLISKVRTTAIPSAPLQKVLSEIAHRYEDANASPVSFHNIRYWFHDDVIQKLSALREAVGQVEDEDMRRFFSVAFSETVRRVSRTRYNEFKLLRRKNDAHNLSVMKTFRDVSLKNMATLGEFYRNNPPTTAEMLLEERNIVGGIPMGDGTVDLVVTSPPYGDSRTTVAYGQFSRLSLMWLGREERVDRTSLGSKPRSITQDLPSEVLDDFVERIAAKDDKRAKEVFSFYFDLHQAVRIIARKVRPGGHVCIVVGNRRVKGIQLPTDKICADFFESEGFAHIKTSVRAISNKRMPTENSPSNVAGQKDVTMRYEYVVILRKCPPQP
ncbi:MAG: DNA methyltransferase [Candidatus Coatesbacteria bacterium]|nr:MAG: DNA methyltransferase [Candidatus Coatesbacteria bacterium]